MTVKLAMNDISLGSPHNFCGAGGPERFAVIHNYDFVCSKGISNGMTADFLGG